MIKNNKCPICNGSVVTFRIRLYDDIYKWKVGCPECNVFAEGINENETQNKWDRFLYKAQHSMYHYGMNVNER